MARECRDRGHLIDVRKKYSTENKETRILVDSMWVKERCLFRADPPHPDYKAFMSMLTHYTTEGKVKHDDAPDAMSMLKRFATTLTGASVTPIKRLF
jgi:predicted phage terminase large subunit-like protein